MKGPIPGFDRYWEEVRAGNLNTERETEIIRNLTALSPGAKILDAGCGPGRISAALAQEGFDVIGVDINPELIEMAMGRNSGALFIEGDYLDADMGSDFDLILSWHTSWGYDTEERNFAFLARCFDLLKPDGQFLLQTWNPLGLHLQSSNIHRSADGSMIAEVLEFDPAELVISIDRTVVGASTAKRERADCHVYTFRDIRGGLLAANFPHVYPISIPIDHPWQIVKAEKERPS